LTQQVDERSSTGEARNGGEGVEDQGSDLPRGSSDAAGRSTV